MGVVGRVQEVALVLLGGSRLVEQQLGVCWVLTPTSTITAWPHPHLLLGGSLVGGRVEDTEVRHVQSPELVTALLIQHLGCLGFAVVLEPHLDTKINGSGMDCDWSSLIPIILRLHLYELGRHIL